MFSLFCEYNHLEYVRIHVIYREYGIHIRVVAPQEYVNIYSTSREGEESAFTHLNTTCTLYIPPRET